MEEHSFLNPLDDLLFPSSSQYSSACESFDDLGQDMEWDQSALPTFDPYAASSTALQSFPQISTSASSSQVPAIFTSPSYTAWTFSESQDSSDFSPPTCAYPVSQDIDSYVTSPSIVCPVREGSSIKPNLREKSSMSSASGRKSPPYTTSKKHNNGEASLDLASANTARQQITAARIAHSAVERKYRTTLNDYSAQLRTLLSTTTTSDGQSCLLGDNFSGVKPNTRKATVLLSAIEFIKRSRREKQEFANTNLCLREKLASLEKLIECEHCSLSTQLKHDLPPSVHCANPASLYSLSRFVDMKVLAESRR